MSLIDTWYDVYARAQVGPGLRQAFAYDLVYKALGAILLGPVFAWTLSRIIGLSGSLTIANEAIAGFLLSPAGLLFLLFALTFALLAFFAEQAGLMHVAGGASRGAAAPWTDALATALAALPRLLTMALWQAGILLLWLLPLAAAAGLVYKGLLGAHDINWYLAERPPELLLAAALGGLIAAIAAGVLLRLTVDWALSIPICLYEHRCGRAALAESRARMRGHRWRGIKLIAGNLLLVLAVGAGIAWLADAAIGALLGLIDSTRLLVYATAVAVLLLAAFGLVLSFALMAVFAVVVMHLYLELLGLDGVPGKRWNATAREARMNRRHIVLALIALLAAAALLVHQQLADLRIGRDVAITAHRGGAAHGPENTLSAIYRAIDDGADMVEIDVQETADGVVVLLHDSDLMRVAGIPTRIWEVDYDDLRKADVGSWFSPEFVNEPVPTLEEALLVAQTRIGLNVELKFNGHDQRLAERTVELIRDAGCRHCIITSLDQQGLARVRALAPEIPIGQIVTAAIGDPARLDVDLLSMNQARVTPAVVRANRAAGLETHVWTVNDAESMAQMLDFGVDNIITDEPGLLHTMVQERSELSDGELLLLALGRRLQD
jgi:glycerophosphoryl diester phosphodiesterase